MSSLMLKQKYCCCDTEPHGLRVLFWLLSEIKKPEDYIPDFNPNKPKFSLDNTGPIHVCDIIKTFDNKSSCDLDGLCLKILKKIAINISVPLAHIFNLSLDKGIFPPNLKTSRIVPVFKSGDPKVCDNYRPSALVSTLSKILEKIVLYLQS